MQSMDSAEIGQDLLERLENLLAHWQKEGIPARWELQNSLIEIIEWKDRTQPEPLWKAPPLMLTATLDDGWGHGLRTIELCARAAGLHVLSLGLLQTGQTIVSACLSHQADLLGLTVLQFDSEPTLSFISRNIPSHTRLIAGGPPFQIDPELGTRAGVHFVARNVSDFLVYILKNLAPTNR